MLAPCASSPLNPHLSLLQPYPFERLRALVCRCHAQSAPDAHQPVDRRAQAPDAAIHSRRAVRGQRRPRELSHNGQAARAARGHRARGSGDATDLRRSMRQRRCCRCSAAARRCSRLRRRSSMPAASAPRWSFPIRSIRSTKARRCSPAPHPTASTVSRPRLRAAVGSDPGRGVGTDAGPVCLLAGQPDGTRHDTRRLAPLVRVVGSTRLRDRRRRVLFRGVLRRGCAASWLAGRGECARTHGLPAAHVVRQPVQAFERAWASLRLRRRRRLIGQGVSALPHVSRLGDVAGGRRRQPCRMEGR